MSVALSTTPATAAGTQNAIRVMVVDDAVVVRGLVSRWVEEQPGLQLVASVRTGRDAVAQVERANPDVMVLDVEMPDLDGISALPLLLEKKRNLVIIMASTLTRRNAEISLKALSLGAADYIPKPETNRGVTTSVEFRRELIDKILQLGRRAKGLSERQMRAPAPASAAAAALRPASVAASESHGRTGPFKLRPFATTQPRVLLIGSSTGGPQALTALVSQLKSLIERVPVLITQHMPPTFTTILAEHLTRAASRPAHEATDGEPIVAGKIYVAPGGRHMSITRANKAPVITLTDGPPINFCKPAVDPMFSSAAQVWGNAILAVILTGMGSDGTRGGAAIVEAGSSIIAQDEATSVVWGMPGSAAHAGLCSAVLPLDQIAQKVIRLFSGDRS
ncbi:MAG TPA: chemotaxis response regulator protein-glutamate methylesterase [Xanthobacteraceae bacterium]|jgi:two-component system chemotaxis response regulator CheB|nr:chemotaxis response regulator protein-glutamate methylesterase [Xanthobacteraceae bacterium]